MPYPAVRARAAVAAALLAASALAANTASVPGDVAALALERCAEAEGTTSAHTVGLRVDRGVGVLAFDGVDPTRLLDQLSLDPFLNARTLWRGAGRFLWADALVTLVDADGVALAADDVDLAVGPTRYAALAKLEEADSLSRGASV